MVVASLVLRLLRALAAIVAWAFLFEWIVFSLRPLPVLLQKKVCEDQVLRALRALRCACMQTSFGQSSNRTYVIIGRLDRICRRPSFTLARRSVRRSVAVKRLSVADPGTGGYGSYQKWGFQKQFSSFKTNKCGFGLRLAVEKIWFWFWSQRLLVLALFLSHQRWGPQ